MKRHVALALALAFLVVAVSSARAQSAKPSSGKAAGGASLTMADRMAARAEKRREVPKKTSKGGGWATGGGWQTNKRR